MSAFIGVNEYVDQDNEDLCQHKIFQSSYTAECSAKIGQEKGYACLCYLLT